ncbi:MAG TPA: hypothetical protein IAA88_02645 [Candidatus Avimuribaculum pullicola]|nr:hypothetical protein [Candidatus Avimuribaculum pullicola]
MTLLRHILAAMLIAMLAATACAADGEYYGDTPPAQAPILPGYSIEHIRQRLAESPLQPIEGIWEYPEEMMTIVVEQFSSPQFSHKLKYRIVLLDSEDMSLLPGTVIGYIAESADDKKFQLWLYSQQDGLKLLGPSQCVATLQDGNTSLIFKRGSLKMRVRFNLTRFLPRLFRFISVSPYIDKEELPIGFSKVYPAYDDNESMHHEIRYL